VNSNVISHSLESNKCKIWLVVVNKTKQSSQSNKPNNSSKVTQLKQEITQDKSGKQVQSISVEQFSRKESHTVFQYAQNKRAENDAHNYSL